MNEEKSAQITIPEEKKEPGCIPQPLPDSKQAFCVALPISGGRPLKLMGDNPHDFISFLKDSSVAWLNFPVKDIKKDAEIIAMSLGFSSSLAPTILSGYLSAYEDRDTEMGLMLPAVAVKKFDVLISPILFLIRKDLIVTIHEENVTRLVRLSRYADAELMTDSPKLLARMGILADDVNRHIALSEHMSDVLASGLEVLQSIYNNQLQILNNRLALVMTWLTILGTAVLVPNTIATVLGNSAFEMGPKDQGWYILLIISSTIFATWAAYWWINKKGLMPHKVE